MAHPPAGPRAPERPRLLSVRGLLLLLPLRLLALLLGSLFRWRQGRLSVVKEAATPSTTFESLQARKKKKKNEDEGVEAFRQA